jgi:hypothetical protein
LKSWLLATLAGLVGIVALVLLWPMLRHRKTMPAAFLRRRLTPECLWPVSQPLAWGEVFAKRYRFPDEEKIYHARRCEHGRKIGWPIRFASSQHAEQAGYRACWVCRPDRIA